jgi:hypothetical protein
MTEYSAKELLPLVKSHGRTFFNEDKNAIFFDWTCSGFTVSFTGSRLVAKVLALPDKLPSPPGMPEQPADFPCIGAVADGSDELIFRQKCSEGENELCIFEGENGTHTVRIIKLSEYARGKAALISLSTDGEVVSCLEDSKKLSIEFVGDSITCGYGNEASSRDVHFETSEENGWLTYGAVCSRELDADFNMISVSGISTSQAKYPLFPMIQMDEVYDCTDYYCDTRLGSVPQKWDFASNKKDIVVINLGTNDSLAVWSKADLSQADEEESQFCVNYRKFIESVRSLNGKDTFIICTLGPMDFYLFDKISAVVDKYRADTGDNRITAFKLRSIDLMAEGYGADSHPSIKTHLRMGHELAARIRALKL